jgi:hypothetical protein
MDTVFELHTSDHIRQSMEPLSNLHLFSADGISLKTIVKQAIREPLPLVRRWRNRTVANVLSIGLPPPIERPSSGTTTVRFDKASMSGGVTRTPRSIRWPVDGYSQAYTTTPRSR